MSPNELDVSPVYTEMCINKTWLEKFYFNLLETLPHI